MNTRIPRQTERRPHSASCRLWRVHSPRAQCAKRGLTTEREPSDSVNSRVARAPERRKMTSPRDGTALLGADWRQAPLRLGRNIYNEPWTDASATTASSGSNRVRRTTAGRPRSGADRGSVGGAARRVAAAARSRRGAGRAAHLRLRQLHHVLARGLPLLRAAQAQLSRAVPHPAPRGEGAAGPARRAEIKNQVRQPRSDPSSRRGRAADHRLDARGLRVAGCNQDEAEAEAEAEAKRSEAEAPRRGKRQVLRAK